MSITVGLALRGQVLLRLGKGLDSYVWLDDR